MTPRFQLLTPRWRERELVVVGGAWVVSLTSAPPRCRLAPASATPDPALETAALRAWQVGGRRVGPPRGGWLDGGGDSARWLGAAVALETTEV